MMDIEMLYFESCLSWKNALEFLQDVLSDMQVEGKLRLTLVETEEEAAKQRFVGSPSLRVNGDDLFPTGSNDYNLGCRIYSTPDGLQGWPTQEMVRAAIETYLEATQSLT